MNEEGSPRGGENGTLPRGASPAHHVSDIAGRTVAWEDFGGCGPPLLALHGTFGRGSVFAPLARRAEGRFRVIAPDLRGHGHSARADDYGARAFVADAAAFVEHLGLGPLPVLGHSRGGVVALQLAAAHAESVSSLIVEDIGAVLRSPEVAHPVLDVRGWPRSAASREELGAAIEAAGVPDSGYFLQSAVRRRTPEGTCWELLFDWDDMMAVQDSGIGDWWADWLGSSCPALLLRGGESPMLSAAAAREMCRRRGRTRLVEFPGAGHWVHDDDAEGVAEAIADFLAR
ncbi:Pimeloyl-ACP methyl ester carboxylesterase [Streptomyces sp. WMMB 714]|uniref:alpha/beta fold hydrolase n=1 Tax=Streptomyces sp. WMMB 714 TaxID=1286822 RepID=UPI000823D02C|nr:alpha/beta hydrolase [Streptomyces sp. WMMB 714]SCK19451.1 Pimeloyl-ACP methyl ester carboxylesterase [Streptomyces sp. WMMB 714]